MQITVGLFALLATQASAPAPSGPPTSAQGQPMMQSALAPGEVPFTQILTGLDSPIKKSGVRVIHDEKEWQDFLAKMNDQNVKKPKIDWNQYEVVVATLSGSSNSGITFRVDKIHAVKGGKTAIECVLDQQIGNSRMIDTTNSDNYLGHTQYPYAVLQTPKIQTRWDIRVTQP